MDSVDAAGWIGWSWMFFSLTSTVEGEKFFLLTESLHLPLSNWSTNLPVYDSRQRLPMIFQKMIKALYVLFNCQVYFIYWHLGYTYHYQSHCWSMDLNLLLSISYPTHLEDQPPEQYCREENLLKAGCDCLTGWSHHEYCREHPGYGRSQAGQNKLANLTLWCHFSALRF